ncbi:hypothetical protein [Saccharothrix deserti]|uniref:hypothetical protein n=1 Tax=Saccharothrix deserti TaxID=2593674 RepID=UPI00131AE332|nr:hypothetical protein [Saccharothrix deserti]
MADPQHPVASTFAIREAHDDDWPQMWSIIHDVITEQQTVAYDPGMSELFRTGFDGDHQAWMMRTNGPTEEVPRRAA